MRPATLTPILGSLLLFTACAAESDAGWSEATDHASQAVEDPEDPEPIELPSDSLLANEGAHGLPGGPGLPNEACSNADLASARSHCANKRNVAGSCCHVAAGACHYNPNTGFIVYSYSMTTFSATLPTQSWPPECFGNYVH